MSNNNLEEKIYIQLIDYSSIVISFLLASWIRFGNVLQQTNDEAYELIFLFLLLGAFIILNTGNPYVDFFRRGFFREFENVFKLNMILLLIISAILFYLKIGPVYSRGLFTYFFFSNIVIDYVLRQCLKYYMLEYYKKSKLSSKIMVVSTSDSINLLIEKMKKGKEWEYLITCIGIIDTNMVGESVMGIPVVANKETILNEVKRTAIDEVFISIPFGIQFEAEELILNLENMGVIISLNLTFYGMNLDEKTIKRFYGFNVLTFSTKFFNKVQLKIKRLIDFVGAIVGMGITLVIGIIIAPAILIESPGPIIFSQTRLGKNGRKFKIYKFRSMYLDAESKKNELMAKNEMQGLMFKMAKDPRVTRVGSFIRKTSIDELPQFFNVFRGDMSLVGTRPPTEDEFLQYEGRHKRRLALKPGITGLWQVSGRNDIEDFEDVIKLDLQYIDNWSLLLDLKLLLKTLFVVVMRVGAK